MNKENLNSYHHYSLHQNGRIIVANLWLYVIVTNIVPKKMDETNLIFLCLLDLLVLFPKYTQK